MNIQFCLRSVLLWRLFSTIQSDQGCLKEDNIKYFGKNIVNKISAGVNECANWCGETPRCKFWTLRKSNNRCWIKASISDKRSNKKVISGTKGCATGCLKEDNIDYYGNEIANKISADVDECANWCGETQACNFWTLRKSDNRCWIKTSDSGRRNKNDTISGTKICATAPVTPASPNEGCFTEPDYNYPGYDLGAPVRHVDWKACRDSTVTIAKAHYWTFRFLDRLCWLKSSNRNRKAERKGVLISGDAGCREGCFTEPDYNYPGYDIGTPLRQVDWKACRDSAVGIANAHYWTFRFLDRLCWMKSSNRNRKAERKGVLISGDAGCREAPTTLNSSTTASSPSTALSPTTAPSPTSAPSPTTAPLLTTTSITVPGLEGKVCTKENGFCVLPNGEHQNSGVIQLDADNGNTVQQQAKCLSKCLAYSGATGCEVIWNQGNYGCYVHTQVVDKGNNVGNHTCWIFSKCRAPTNASSTTTASLTTSASSSTTASSTIIELSSTTASPSTTAPTPEGITALWTQGKDINCWGGCGNKGGLCVNVCGPRGYCCRKGFSDCLEEAQKVAIPNYHSCVIQSGCMKEDNINYYGNDITNKISEGVDKCANWCGETIACKFWTLNKPDNRCWLKTSDSGRRSNNDAISGTKSCAAGCLKEDNIDYYGNEIANKISGGVDECANWCGEIQTCNFWTLRKSDNRCWIKTSDSGRRSDNDKISGTQRCVTGCPFEMTAPIFSSSYDMSSPAPQWSFIFQTTAIKVNNKIGWPTYPWNPDGHLSSIYNPIMAIWYHFQPNSQTFRASGFGPLPEHMQQLSPHSRVMGGTLSYDAYNSGGEWLMAVHPTGKPGYVTGFLHVEDHYRNLGQTGFGPAFKSIALACSSDWGRTWSKRGRIMTTGTKPSDVIFDGVGDLDVVWDWQESRWLMIMQNKIGINKGAKLTAAVSYDKGAAADSWRKWNGTAFTVSNWEQPGEYLKDTEEKKTLKGGANPSIHWNTHLQLWIMVYGGWDGNAYITSAKRLPHFSKSRVLIEGDKSIKNWYPTLMSIDGGDRQGGENLHLYYRKRFMNDNKSDFMTRQIKLCRGKC